MMPTFSPGHRLGRGSAPTAVAVAVAAMVLVAGCGGGAGQAAGPAKSTPSAVKSTPSKAKTGVVLSITGTEYSFAPTALRASPGLTTFHFTNDGAVDHDFTIDALHVHLMENPGKTGQATVTLRAGTYVFYCAIPGHSQSGMHGKLTVS